jgi:excisionase family DNA binding protein
MARTPSLSSIEPGDVDVEVAGRTARRLRDYLQAHPSADPLEVHVEGDDSEVLVVPRAGAALLAQALAAVENGRGVALVANQTQLTTQQAADILNVSRPYLIGLLENEEIPFRKVGTHRRIAFADLMDYKRRDEQKRRQAAADLTALSEEFRED